MRTISTLSGEVPAASRQCFSATSEASACVSVLPFTLLTDAVSSGGMPETNTSPPPLVTSDSGTPMARTAADNTGTSTICLAIAPLLPAKSSLETHSDAIEPIAPAPYSGRRPHPVHAWLTGCLRAHGLLQVRAISGGCAAWRRTASRPVALDRAFHEDHHRQQQSADRGSHCGIPQSAADQGERPPVRRHGGVRRNP